MAPVSLARTRSISPHIIHNEDIIRHLYDSGFQAGNYADTLLHVHQNSYRLHAIILSRSPYLVHLMSTSPPSGSGQRVIHVDLEQEPEVTREGFAIALGYLYSSVSLSLLRPENARGVLAAARLLGGLDDLCAYAYDACRHSITLDTIDEWLDFIGRIPSPDGTTTPDFHPASSIFGLYAQQLRDDVFHFLVVALPSALDIHRPPGIVQDENPQGGRNILLKVFARVPFDLFKAAVESPDFQIGSEQARFKFAKDAIEFRKRGVARGAGAEETVVLAFGGASAAGSVVHVTRKLRKKPLWKVST
ncbi:hypothetical protein OF83DRAFT_34057 [Amylostereum chailletii]|nr:hypothetical protein OF83DRAFT_34057 [Amylostereum chailletii]